MNLRKLIAPLLITAMTSPLCCCYSEVFLAEEAVDLYCCSAQEVEKNSAESGHSAEDCPHRGGKVFKEANTEHLKGFHLLSFSPVFSGTLLSGDVISERSALFPMPGIERSANLQVLLKRYQAHSVYLL